MSHGGEVSSLAMIALHHARGARASVDTKAMDEIGALQQAEREANEIIQKARDGRWGCCCPVCCSEHWR